MTIDGNTETTVIGSDGTWTVTYPAGTFPGGEYTTGITAVATDGFGNSATFTDTLVVDTVTSVAINTSTVGSDGTINGAEYDGGVAFTGTAQPGASVDVTIGSVTQTVVAGADGSWSSSFSSTQLTDGEYTGTVTAVATDGFGNTATSTGTFEVDTFVRDFSITSTTGGADGVINAEEAGQPLTVSGMTEPGSTVTVELGGATATAVVSANGSWTATFAAGSVAAGTYTATMTATATDAAGNMDTATTSVAVDTEAGLLTIDSTPVEGDDVVNEDEASDGVVLTGTADAGAAVTVTMEGMSHNVVADGNGNWEAFFSANDVAAGVYTAEITATTTDAAGNSRSATDSVQVDTRVDNLSVAAGDIAVDNIISAAEANGNVTVNGTTEVGSTSVIVTLGGQTATAVVDAAGNWSVTIPAGEVRSGAYAANISVEATDHVGNVAVIDDTLSIDTAAPDGPVIASFTRDGDGIRGISIETEMVNGAPTTDVQSLVQVQADGTIADVAGQQGFNSLCGETDFVFNNDVPNGSQLIVNSTDDAGNTSGTFLVLDDEAATNSVDLTNMALGDYQIENFDLDFAEAASVVIDEASLLALSTNSNTLTIHGSGEDTVIIQGGAAQGTTVGDDGQTYNVYSVGTEGTLLVDQEIPVTI